MTVFFRFIQEKCDIYETASIVRQLVTWLCSHDKVSDSYNSLPFNLFDYINEMLVFRIDKVPKSAYQRYLLLEETSNRSRMDKISYWKPEVAIKFVHDFTIYPRNFGTSIKYS